MTSVSVIIPVFNSQATLERAVASVIYEPLVKEVIIVDDGSSDDSLIIAKNLETKHNLVKLHFHPCHQNKGAAASRNLGLAHANSEWIQFLDADDELLSGKLVGQIEMVGPGISLVIGNSIHLFPDGRRHYRKSDKEIWKGLIRSKLGDTCANLWNKKYLFMVGGWDENLSSSQEYNLMFRILTCHPYVVFDRRYLTIIHKTENSISTLPDKKNQRTNNWLNLRAEIRKHLIKNGQFHLFHKYNFSGSVGIFCNENQMDFPITVDKGLYKLYKLETSIKIKIYNLLNFN